MPLYLYRCNNGHVHEELRKESAREHLGGCHVCGWASRPIISTPSFRFAIPGVKGHFKKSAKELPNA